jgi:hypothetical protein
MKFLKTSTAFWLYGFNWTWWFLNHWWTLLKLWTYWCRTALICLYELVSNLFNIYWNLLLLHEIIILFFTTASLALASWLITNLLLTFDSWHLTNLKYIFARFLNIRTHFFTRHNFWFVNMESLRIMPMGSIWLHILVNQWEPEILIRLWWLA